MRFTLSIIALVVSCIILGTLVVKEITLNQDCTGYLKRASDANSVELAEAELEKTICYVERHGLTSGYTSILYQTPDEDLTFWYANLKECQDELDKVDSTTSQLEKTNVLMKLRETLTDASQDGTSLTYPDGLSRYPHNGMWAVLIFLSACGIIWFLIEVLFRLN